jgi:hypothetical protein
MCCSVTDTLISYPFLTSKNKIHIKDGIYAYHHKTLFLPTIISPTLQVMIKYEAFYILHAILPGFLFLLLYESSYKKLRVILGGTDHFQIFRLGKELTLIGGVDGGLLNSLNLIIQMHKIKMVERNSH